MSQMLASLGDNQMFGAGFGLISLGLAATVARKGLQVGMIVFRRHYMTTVEVTCKDKSYPWVLDWVAKRGARKTQHLSVDTAFVETEGGKVETKYNFVPSPGAHFMRYNGTWIKVDRNYFNWKLYLLLSGREDEGAEDAGAVGDCTDDHHW